MANFFEKQAKKEAAQAEHFANMYADFYESQKDRNNERYAQVLARLDDQYKYALDRISTYGRQAVKDLNQRFVNREANAVQGITNAGLGNTTIVNAAQNDVRRQRLDEIGRTEAALSDQRINMQNQLDERRFQLQERYENAYPASRELVRLSALTGRSLGGLGGGPVSEAAGGFGGYIDTASTAAAALSAYASGNYVAGIYHTAELVSDYL